MRRAALLLIGLVAGCPKGTTTAPSTRAPAAAAPGGEVVVWSRDLGAAIRGGPIIDAGILYMGDDAGTVHAIEARSGRVLYDVPLRAEGFLPVLSKPALGGGRLFVADSGGQITALNPATGERLWAVRVEGTPAAPLVTDGKTLWVASGEFGIFALNAETGEERWRRVDQQRWRSLVLVGEHNLCARGFTDPEGNGLVLCLDRERGWERWRQYFGSVDDTALVPLEDGRLLATRRTGVLELIGREGMVERSLPASPEANSELLLSGDRLWMGGWDGALRSYTLPGLEPAPGVAEVASRGATLAAPARVCGELVTAEYNGVLRAYATDSGALSWIRALALPGVDDGADPLMVLGAEPLVIAVADRNILGISPPSCAFGPHTTPGP